MATDKGVAFGDFSNDEVDMLYNDSKTPVQFSLVAAAASSGGGSSGNSSQGQHFAVGSSYRGNTSSPEFTFISKGLPDGYTQDIQFGSSPILSEISPSPLATANEEDSQAKLLNANANEFVPSNRSVIKRVDPNSNPSHHGTFVHSHHLSHAPPPYPFYPPYFQHVVDPRYYQHPTFPYPYFAHPGYRMPFPAPPPNLSGVSPQIAVVAPYRTSGDTRPSVRVSDEKVRGNEYTVPESNKTHHHSLSPSSLPSPPSSSIHGDSGIDLGQSKSVSPPSSIPPPISFPLRPSSVNAIHDLSGRTSPTIEEAIPTDKDTSIKDELTNQTNPTHQTDATTPLPNEIEDATNIPSVNESTPINTPSSKATPPINNISTDPSSPEGNSPCGDKVVQQNKQEECTDQNNNRTTPTTRPTDSSGGTSFTTASKEPTVIEKPIQKVAPVNSLATPTNNKNKKTVPTNTQKSSKAENLPTTTPSNAEQQSTTTPTSKEELKPVLNSPTEVQTTPTTKSNGSVSNGVPQTPPIPKSGKSWASIVGNNTSAGPKIQPLPHLLTNKKLSTVEREDKHSEEPHLLQSSEETTARLRQLGDQLKMRSVCYDPVSLKPRGLRNSGNLCYIHAPLQALISCPSFYHLFRSLQSSLPEDTTILPNTTATAVTDAMLKFVGHFHPYPRDVMYEEIKNGVKRKRALVYEEPFWPDFIYEMLTKKNSCLSVKGRQEDAEEFLCWVLSKLHEEMVAALQTVSPEERTKKRVEGEEEKEEEDKGSDEEEWQEVGPRNKSTITRRMSCEESPISKMFGGKLQSTLHRYGMKETVTVQPFFSLQLDIQSDDVYTVKDALEMLCVKENISLSSDSDEMGATRRITLAELPQCLILHIKRFLFDGTTTHKIHKPVEYDQDLEIPKDLIAVSVRGKLSHAQRCYKLWAVVCHQGKTVDKGHYICDVFHSATSSWIRVNDNYVKNVPAEFVFNPSRAPNPHVPYLLFYRQSDTTVRRM